MRKITSVLLLVSLVLMTVTGSFAATPDPTPIPWEIPLDDGLPAVIDRFGDPAAYPDFSFPEDAKLLEIWVANTRDSDAFFLLYDGQCWMIDCADNRWVNRVVTLMQKLGINKVDKIINSHPHHDHLNGLAAVAAIAEVDELAVGFAENSTEHMVKAMKTCKEKGISVTHFEDGTRLMLGDVILDILMKCDDTAELNDRSAVIRLQYGDRTALFTGDIETVGQKKLLETVDPSLLKTDVLKYPHHGKSKLVENFYNAVNPSFVVVTNNAVTGEAPYYLGCKHVPMAYAISAYVHLVTDGNHWLTERVAEPEAWKKQ